MTTQSFYSRLSENQSPETRGITMNVKTSASKAANISKSRHEITISDLKKVLSENLQRRLHVNGKSAGLFFYTKDNLPWTGSRYYKLDEKLPNFIVKNIKYHRYLGAVDVIAIEGDQLIVSTIQGRKRVLKSVFVSNAVDSIKECVNSSELERLQFNQRMDNTENDYTNHYSAL